MHQFQDVPALAPVAELQEAACAGERVDELSSITDEQARRHELIEQRVVRSEELRQRVSLEGPLRGRARAEPRLDGLERLQPRVDGRANVAVLAVNPPVSIDRLEIVRERPRALT